MERIVCESPTMATALVSAMPWTAVVSDEWLEMSVVVASALVSAIP